MNIHKAFERYCENERITSEDYKDEIWPVFEFAWSVRQDEIDELKKRISDLEYYLF